jgi:hypothetical protein
MSATPISNRHTSTETTTAIGPYPTERALIRSRLVASKKTLPRRSRIRIESFPLTGPRPLTKSWHVYSVKNGGLWMKRYYKKGEHVVQMQPFCIAIGVRAAYDSIQGI